MKEVRLSLLSVFREASIVTHKSGWRGGSAVACRPVTLTGLFVLFLFIVRPGFACFSHLYQWRDPKLYIIWSHSLVTSLIVSFYYNLN